MLSYPVLLDFPIQRPLADSQHVGGFFAVAGGEAEGFGDEEFFEFLERLADHGRERGGRTLGRRGRRRRPVPRAGRRDPRGRRNRPPPCSRPRCEADGRCPANRMQAVFARGRRHAFDLLAVRGGELLDKIVDQDRDVLAPLAERRQADGDDLEPVVQVAAERALFDRFLEIAIGGGEDADVDLDRRVGADAGDLAVFDHPEEFDLRGQRHVADLVEEHRAAVGVLELADAVGRGIGERSFHVPEQFALENVFARGRRS